MLKNIVAGFALLLTASAWAAGPYDFDKTPGRLPKDVVPTDYDLSLVPDLDKMQLAGRESVKLAVRSATRTIQFDTEDQVLTDVRFDGHPVSNVATDNAQQLTTVTLATPATAGKHVLSFSYTAVIRDDVRGLFVQPFIAADGTRSRLLSSGFEPTDARMMFPCWDEPAFRARFRITIDVPAEWAAISNMPVEHRVTHGARATVSFKQSPRMPTYLVHVTSGDFVRISAHRGATDLGVWAIRGSEADGKIALSNAQDILGDYNSYFGFPFPLPKLDSIAIPGGFSGGMENWGAITYTDRALLITPGSALGDRQQVYATQAHEMAHQWNGDLVTMAWWDDLWLNESFASFMAAHETALRNPEWLWWEGQDKDKERAMAEDGSELSRAIYQPVPDEAAANVSNDSAIIYSKGQAVLRMLEAYLGPDVFRDGVRRLMKARAFSNATSADLWQSLSAASGKDIKALASDWTDQAGFPLLEVRAECGAGGQRTIHLSQQRFLASGTEQGKAHWSIPLRMRVGADGSPQSLLLTAEAQTLGAGHCDEALSLNAETLGYYRVRYDAATLATNTRDFAKLPITDRFALLDDEWALVRSGREPLGNFLNLAAAMGNTPDARAWEQVTDTLDSLENDEVGTPGYAAFISFARSVIKPTADQLGWAPKPGESPALSDLRRRLLTRLGSWGDPAIVAEAQRRFAQYLKDPASLAADDQRMIFEVVGANADQATFDQMLQVAKSAQDPQVQTHAFLSLALVKDPKLAEQVVTIALSTDIPPQANHLPYSMFFFLARRHPEISWRTLHTTDRNLFALFGPEAADVLLQFIPQLYWRAAPMPELKAWLDTRVPKEMATSEERAMESIRLRLAERDALLPAADAYLRQLK